MAIRVIKMPDIGEGIAEVELVAWHVKPGDAVVEDQALADVMTDKASVEIPSPVAGRDMPDDELDLGDAFAEVRDADHVDAHGSITRLSAAATRSGPGKYAHSSACGYGVSQPVTRSIGASR